MGGLWFDTMRILRDAPTYRTMFTRMESFGDRTAVETADASGAVCARTFRDMANRARACCAALEKLCAFAPDAIVGLSEDTSADWPVLFWGILMSGGIPLLINPSLEEKTRRDVLREAGAKVCVSRAEMGDGILRIDPEPLLNAEGVGEERWADAVALHTSGTAGDARIYLYSGKTIADQLCSFEDARKLNEEMPVHDTKPVRILAFLPFHHVFGFSVVYILYAITGQTIIFPRDRSMQTVLSVCRSRRVTHIYAVPMFFNALAAAIRRGISGESLLEKGMNAQMRGETLPEALLSLQDHLLGRDIRHMINGGGHMSKENLRVINAVGYPLFNGFGMTECGVIAVELSKDPYQRSKGGCGYPFSLTETHLTESGELLLRGNSLYDARIVRGERVNNDRREWMPTGDLARMEADGLYIVGRSKDIIVTASGENLAPDGIEEAYAGLPGVKMACVLGLPGKEDEDVCLALYPAPTDADALRKSILRAGDTLSASARVTRVYIAKNPLPVSGSGKVKRAALKAMIPNAPEHFVPFDLTESGESLEEIKTVLRGILSENLPEAGAIGDNDHFINDLGADSLALIGIIAQIEKRFDLVLTDEETKRLFTLDATARCLYAKKRGETYTETAAQETTAKRVTDFAQSAEYIALKHRMEETFKDGFNPYFLPHDSLIRDTSVIGGSRVINLGSYNYLGMSGHPETERAAIEAIQKFGTSASGSRTLAGEKTLYQQLERAIADWKHTDDAIACTGGWATNLAFISCFAREGDFILYDALSHNSITEGVALSKAESKAFAHNDLKMAEDILKRIQGRYNKVLLVTEGVYSMEGDIAPIDEFVRLKKTYGCFLMVDEAHSSGVLGEHGGGVDEYFHLAPTDIDIKYGTMSKTLGACGGYIAANAAVIEFLRYSMNGFVFTAGISPPLAAAVIKAIELIQTDDTVVSSLHRNMEYFTRRCREEGMNIGLAGQSAIVPVLIGADADAARLSALLMRRGVFVPPAMYPAVPMGESRLRFTISATHSIEQLETAVTTLAALMREEGFLQ